MRRSYVISDFFYRLTHSIKRNRTAVVIYTLMCLLFLIIGIVVGVNIGDKTDYIKRNGAAIFAFLRGDNGVVSFFFIDFTITFLYCIFSLSMFFNRVASFLSVAPCMYKSYSLGMQTCVIVTVFSAPAIPMLFVVFVPISVIEIMIICMLSFKCLSFSALNGRCFPSRPDIKAYFASAVPFITAIAVCSLFKAVTAALFGSALIGVI